MYNLIVKKYITIKSYLKYKILILENYNIDFCIQAQKQSIISQVDTLAIPESLLIVLLVTNSQIS